MEEESLSYVREHSEVLKEEVKRWTEKVVDERKNLEAQRRGNQKCSHTKLKRLQRELEERDQQLRTPHDKMGQIRARLQQMDREIMATKNQLNALLKPAKVRNVLPKKHHIPVFTHAYGLNHPFLQWYKEKVLSVITPADPFVAESLRVLQTLVARDAYGTWYDNLTIEEQTNPATLVLWLDYMYPDNQRKRE